MPRRAVLAFVAAFTVVVVPVVTPIADNPTPLLVDAKAVGLLFCWRKFTRLLLFICLAELLLADCFRLIFEMWSAPVI